MFHSHNSPPSCSYNIFVTPQNLHPPTPPPPSVKQHTIKYVKTQHQKGSSECGLFAIANTFAVAIQNGLSPEYLKYDQNSRRGHLMQTLQNMFMSPFPAGKADRKNGIRKEKLYVCCCCK